MNFMKWSEEDFHKIIISQATDYEDMKEANHHQTKIQNMSLERN